MTPEADSETPAVLRAVLLGASNLKMGLPAVFAALRRAAGGPVEVLAACGHGRSYVAWSRIAWGARALPGIPGCGLWQALEERPPLPTVALLTDVGNDLLYGPPVEAVLDGVETCLGRLAERQAAVVATPLPMINLEKLSPLRYHAVRTILFPGRGEPWPSLLERARELDRRLRRLAADQGAVLVEPRASWYGIDPIHVRRRQRRQAWDHILSHWSLRSARPPDLPAAEPAPRIRVPAFAAAEHRLFGVPRRTPQPACRLADGSSVAFY